MDIMELLGILITAVFFGYVTTKFLTFLGETDDEEGENKDNE